MIIVYFFLNFIYLNRFNKKKLNLKNEEIIFTKLILKVILKIKYELHGTF